MFFLSWRVCRKKIDICVVENGCKLRHYSNFSACHSRVSVADCGMCVCMCHMLHTCVHRFVSMYVVLCPCNCFVPKLVFCHFEPMSIVLLLCVHCFVSMVLRPQCCIHALFCSIIDVLSLFWFCTYVHCLVSMYILSCAHVHCFVPLAIVLYPSILS